MQQQSTAALAIRAAIVLLISAGMMACGVILDALAGTGPFGTLFFLVLGMIFGTVQISVIFLTSFPAPAQSSTDQSSGEQTAAE